MKNLLIGIFILAMSTLSCGPKSQDSIKKETATDKEALPATLNLKDANELLAMKRCKEAIPSYKAFLQKYPQDAGAWNLIGLAYFCDNQYDNALSSFKQALIIHPTYTDVHNNLGVYYMDRKEYDLARQEFMIALDDQTYPKAGPYFNLAKMAFVRESYEESRALAKKCMDFVPKSNGIPQESGPLLLYAMSLDRLQRDIEAEAAYRDVLKIDVNNMEANYNLAQVMLRKGDPCQARYFYERVVDTDPLGEYGQKAIAALKSVSCKN